MGRHRHARESPGIAPLQREAFQLAPPDKREASDTETKRLRRAMSNRIKLIASASLWPKPSLPESHMACRGATLAVSTIAAGIIKAKDGDA
jgi:hypothetical protein